MAKKKYYIVKKYYMVHECEIRDYEERHDYYLYKYEANAMKKLKDMRDQDHMPVVDEENYEIRHNTPTHFEAGFEGDYSRGSVRIKVVPMPVMDEPL